MINRTIDECDHLSLGQNYLAKNDLIIQSFKNYIFVSIDNKKARTSKTIREI